MRIEWSPLALEDRDRIFDDYEFDQGNPRAAIMVDGRIEEQVNVLLDHPKLGRPGRADDSVPPPSGVAKPWRFTIPPAHAHQAPAPQTRPLYAGGGFGQSCG